MKTLSRKEIAEVEVLEIQPKKLIGTASNEEIKKAVLDKDESPKKNSLSVSHAGNGEVYINRSQYRALLFLGIVLVVLLAVNVVWSNTNTSLGKNKDLYNVTLVNNMPEIPVTVNDHDTNNYAIHLNATQNTNNNVTINIRNGTN